MFIQTTSFPQSSIKAHREPFTPKEIWLRLSDDTIASLSLTEAQEIVAGLTRELQAEMSAGGAAVTPFEIHEERKRSPQPDPAQMCAIVEDEPPLFTRFELTVIVLVGVAAVVLFVASLEGALA